MCMRERQRETEKQREIERWTDGGTIITERGRETEREREREIDEERERERNRDKNTERNRSGYREVHLKRELQRNIRDMINLALEKYSRSNLRSFYHKHLKTLKSLYTVKIKCFLFITNETKQKSSSEFQKMW